MTFVERLAHAELIDKLRVNGYGPVVEALLNQPGAIYTRQGKIKRRALARVLGWKTSAVDEALCACRQLLASDMN